MDLPLFLSAIDPVKDLPPLRSVGATGFGEEVFTNAKSGDARITICVPTWKDSADALLCRLSRLEMADRCTLLVFDDGSCDPDLTAQLARHVVRYPGPARLISAPKNMGRSHARNRLRALAESDWILFLDADMQPDDDTFLVRYFEAIEQQETPGLIVGGFSLRHVRPTQETRLHAAQSSASECVSASVRDAAPGRYVFTSNILVHRDILDEISFDPEFKGWGWEDVDWGLRVAAKHPVNHIDNTATHLGLDPDDQLIDKYKSSAKNFARLIDRHPIEMAGTPLFRMAKLLGRLPGRAWIERTALSLAKTRRAPLKMRLFGLKLYRASIYGDMI